MTVVEEEKVRCFCCGDTSRQRVLLSSNEFGSRDLDQRPAKMMRSTMDAWLQECPSCGYVARDLKTGDANDRAFVETKEYQSLRDGPHATRLSCRFLLRAVLDAKRGDLESAFQSTLCAAWDADDRKLTEIARGQRRRASTYLADHIGASPDLQLRLLDVLRRASDWERASSLAAKLMETDLEYPLSAVACFQAAKIKLMDDSRYTVADALQTGHAESGR